MPYIQYMLLITDLIFALQGFQGDSPRDYPADTQQPVAEQIPAGQVPMDAVALAAAGGLSGNGSGGGGGVIGGGGEGGINVVTSTPMSISNP